MATPRTPNQKKRYAALNKRLSKYVSLVRSIYDSLGLEAANIITTATDYDGSVPFRFKDYPQTKSRVDELMRFFSRDLQALVYSGTTEEWKQSNLVQDLLANDVLKSYRMNREGERVKRYYQPNNDALKAFQRRKDKGMTVSQKIWNQSYNFKQELEYAISSAIEKGQSAITLSKRISKYLHDFPSLQADYKERFGTATECKDCEYRSIRLARSEINMAYREAEQTRWRQMDFIKGYEIKLSHSHPKYDVCDELTGVYPKWFKWTGWHQNCYSEDSEVLTDKGWKLFKDVEIDDLILSLNPATRELEWVEIEDMQCYEHKGEMIHFYNKSLDCLVTPDHQMVYVNKSNGELKKCAASEYRKGKGGFYRGCEYEAEDIKTITIAYKQYDFDTFCEFMAYYLSDGSLQRNSGICIAQKDGQPYKEDIANCIRRMGYEPKNYGDTLFIYDCKLNAYLKQFGKAHDKFIPAEIKNASKQQIKLFLEAYSKCDGYTRCRTEGRFNGNHGQYFTQKNEERMYFSISELMVRDLSELILKVGHRPSFCKREPGTTHTSKGREIKSNYPCWVVNECYSTTATVFDKDIVSYEGYVYDLTLERNHIMCIRRNGKCFWGSNCMCYVIPIVMTDDEWYSGKGQEITEVPDNYKTWVIDNADRIEKSEEKGTLPYFLKDNPEYKHYINTESEISENKIFGKSISKIAGEKDENEMVLGKEAISTLNSVIDENQSWVKGDFAGFREDAGLRDSYMKHYTYLDKETNKFVNYISISSRDFKVIDEEGKEIIFNPMAEIRGALYAIKNGKSLTFNQEYAIEGLWHEILHAGAVGWKEQGKHDLAQIMPMEIINQFCARRSYQKLLRALGAEPVHQQNILLNGYGYKDELKKFLLFLNSHKITDEKAYTYFNGKIKSFYYENIEGTIVRFLTENKIKEPDRLWQSFMINITDE